MSRILFIIFSLAFFNSYCQNTTSLVTAPIVEKAFVKKNGQPTELKEYYIQQSIQDYFIKFCESGITKEDLTNYLSKFDTKIPSATLEIEYREGSWDICNGNQEQQSRIGEYVIIHRIIEN